MKIITYSTLTILLIIGFILVGKTTIFSGYTFGEKIDSLNGVNVYYNGSFSNVKGRHLTKDGYNLGLKYQCVEFVKRYYYEALNHKMPNSYGHAKDFFDSNIKDGERNAQRNLKQFTNPSQSKPRVADLVVYSGTIGNKFGHVSIISKVSDEEIEVIQQNSNQSRSLAPYLPSTAIQNTTID